MVTVCACGSLCSTYVFIHSMFTEDFLCAKPILGARGKVLSKIVFWGGPPCLYLSSCDLEDLWV